jgi:glucose/mannose transport system permease protein
LKIQPRGKKRINLALKYLVIVVVCGFFLLPFLLSLNTAFKPADEVSNVTALPSRLYLGNFAVGFQTIARSMLNSFLIVTPGSILGIILGAFAAYPLAQLRFKGDTAVYLIMLAGMYIPFSTILIPLFLIIRNIGLYDTYAGLWLVYTAIATPYMTLILRNFFATIPDELREAATLDGCGLIRYFWKILLPVSQTALAACFILNFRSFWNEFILALTLTRSPEFRPVTVALQYFVNQSSDRVEWGPLMGAVVFAIMPTIIVFLVFKKQFVRGFVGIYK